VLPSYSGLKKGKVVDRLYRRSVKLQQGNGRGEGKCGAMQLGPRAVMYV
jgi:hypothetical protein